MDKADMIETAELMQQLPHDIRDGIEPLKLSKHHTYLVLSTYSELVRYANLGLIVYEYRESTGRVYSIDNFSRQVKKLEADYKRVQPFLYNIEEPLMEEHHKRLMREQWYRKLTEEEQYKQLIREKVRKQPMLIIPHPSIMLKELENRIPESERAETLSALTGKPNLQRRTSIEKLTNGEVFKTITDIPAFIEDLKNNTK